MNISYLKYAVEIEKTGSITTAAQNLYMNQPHVSKMVRELEKELGSPIFTRTRRGMVPTKEGEEFLRQAKSVLAQIEALESLCEKQRSEKNIASLNISAPRASYVSHAVASLVKELGNDVHLNIQYRETGSKNTIRSVADKTFDLGIVRIPLVYQSYYTKMAEDENLILQQIWDFSYHVLFDKKHPLSEEKDLTYLKLKDYTEISFGDVLAPSISFHTNDSASIGDNQRRQISVYDRGCQFELLHLIPGAYIWASPVPYDILNREGLVSRPCSRPGNQYQDALIYRKGYDLSKIEQSFMHHIHRISSQLSQ